MSAPSDPASDSPPAGAAARNGSSADVSLREQAVAAFGALRRRAGREVSPERLRAFLQAKTVTPETLFGALADFGRAHGMVAAAGSVAADDLMRRATAGDLLLLPGPTIGLIEEVRPDTGEISYYDVEAERRWLKQVDALADGDAPLRLLHFDGEAQSFLRDRAGDPVLQGDTSAHYDPHDHQENIQETFASLLRLLSDESSDLITVAIYASIVALFSLTIPLASQGIIDSVSLGTFTNQIVVLCAAVSVGLLLYGAFNVLQYYTVDMLQRRLFASSALEMAYRLPSMRRSALEGEYGPALVNRFFDVVSMQKSLSKLLLNGMEYALVALASLVLLTIYSTFFLLVGLLAVLFAPVLIWGLGRNGLKTSIEQSSTKYAMAHWLEDLARCQQSFKLNGAMSYVHTRTDRIASEYVRARDNHFRVFGRQLAAAAIFRALIVGLALGIGGYLVTGGQITLGQFVAAELVIVSLTSNSFNLVELFVSGYDLLTAISKILHVTEKPLESLGGEDVPEGTGPAALRLQNVTIRYGDDTPALDDVSFEVEAGTHLCVVGESGAGKTTLTRALVRLHDPDQGQITFDGHDVARLDPQAYRRVVGLAMPTDELFKGTVEENITMGRSFDYETLERALRLACLDEDILTLPDGLKTPVMSAGLEFPEGLVRRIMIARAVIGDPRVLVLDEAFNGVEESTKRRLADRIYGHDAWTLISVVDDNPTAVRYADRVVVLDGGRVAWTGAPDQLRSEPGTFLEGHFPQLVAALRRDPATP
jgi:ATP-binding cassette subfamily B protein